MAGLESPEITEFLSEIPKRLLDPPWNTNISIVNNWPVS